MKQTVLQSATVAGPWACERSYLDYYIERDRARIEVTEGQDQAVFDPAASPYDPPLYERRDDGVALVSLSGPMTKRESYYSRYMGGSSTVRIRKAIEAAVYDPATSKIFVVAETPGGMHAGTSELADTIRAAAQVKPTYTFADDLAASAGLWVIAAGQRVFANRSAIIGSIGTYLVVWDSSAMYAAAGIKVHVISSAAPIKGSGTPGAEIVPAQLAAWQKTVDQMSGLFVASLADLRGLGLSDVEKLATGDVWGAEEAKSYGLIDDVMSLSEAIDSVRKEKPMSKSVLVTGQTTSAAPAAEPQSTAPAAAPAAPTAPADTVSRADFEALQAQLQTVTAEGAAARQTLESIQAQARTQRFATMASEHGLPNTMAGVLDRAEASLPAADFAALTSAFKAVRAQAADPSQFTEIGTAISGASDNPADQLQAIAAGLLKEGKATTKAAALTLAAKQNPALYEAHTASLRRK